MVQLYIGVAIAVLVVVYLWLKKSRHQEENLPTTSKSNLPAVSEDVNLPAVNEPVPPVAQTDANQPPQQQ